MIARCPRHSSKSFYKFASQRSVKKRLVKDQPYYVEMPFFDYGSGYYAKMGVLMDKTERTWSQVAGAVNEKQSIQINSIYKIEKQVLDFTFEPCTKKASPCLNERCGYYSSGKHAQ